MTKPDIPILDDDAVAEIEARANAATTAPWHTAKRRAALIIAEDKARVADCHVGIGMDVAEAQINAEFIAHAREDIPALCATVRVLRAEKAEQRGLTLISALVNFTDWLHAEGLLSVDDERERAQLVLRFFDAHTEGENYFMQAGQIMEILGQPFQEQEAKQS